MQNASALYHSDQVSSPQRDEESLEASQKVKETSDSGRQVRQRDSLLRNQKSVTGQVQARQEKTVDLLVSVARKVADQVRIDSTITLKKKCPQYLWQRESGPYHDGQKRHKIPVFILYSSLCVTHSNRSVTN